MKKFSAYTWFLFIALSIAGILLFIVPVNTAEGIKVPIAMLAGWLSNLTVPFIHWFAFIVFIIGAVGSIIMHFIPQKGPRTFMDSLFRVHWFWTIMRVLAVIFAAMYLWQFGPEAVNSDITAGILLAPDGGLVTMMFSLFFFAGLLLPLLTNFGLLEFFGSLMVKVMRPIFKIPGRAAIDCLASWVGDGTIGVLLTSKQYEDKNYTSREATVIATTFSVVSITFCIVVLETIGLNNYFLEFYGSVIVVGLILALIMPRIFPLKRKADTLIDGSKLPENHEDIPADFNAVTFGLHNALSKAN